MCDHIGMDEPLVFTHSFGLAPTMGWFTIVSAGAWCIWSCFVCQSSLSYNIFLTFLFHRFNIPMLIGSSRHKICLVGWANLDIVTTSGTIVPFIQGGVLACSLEYLSRVVHLPTYCLQFCHEVFPLSVLYHPCAVAQHLLKYINIITTHEGTSLPWIFAPLCRSFDRPPAPEGPAGPMCHGITSSSTSTSSSLLMAGSDNASVVAHLIWLYLPFLRTLAGAFWLECSAAEPQGLSCNGNASSSSSAEGSNHALVISHLITLSLPFLCPLTCLFAELLWDWATTDCTDPSDSNHLLNLKVSVGSVTCLSRHHSNIVVASSLVSLEGSLNATLVGQYHPEIYMPRSTAMAAQGTVTFLWSQAFPVWYH